MLTQEEKRDIKDFINKKMHDISERIVEYKQLTKPIPPSEGIGRLSRMDAMQQQSMDTAKEVRRIERIKLIKAALKRLEEGDYGYCLNCDATISNGRLRLDPSFSLCIDCAK